MKGARKVVVGQRLVERCNVGCRKSVVDATWIKLLGGFIKARASNGGRSRVGQLHRGLDWMLSFYYSVWSLDALFVVHLIPQDPNSRVRRGCCPWALLLSCGFHSRATSLTRVGSRSWSWRSQNVRLENGSAEATICQQRATPTAEELQCFCAWARAFGCGVRSALTICSVAPPPSPWGRQQAVPWFLVSGSPGSSRKLRLSIYNSTKTGLVRSANLKIF
jgi:hypothetical protein